jgi:hypothetical protein
MIFEEINTVAVSTPDMNRSGTNLDRDVVRVKGWFRALPVVPSICSGDLANLRTDPQRETF